MNTTVTHAPITGEETSAAVFHPGWLPDVEAFPELAELREEYQRLQDQLAEKSACVQDVKARIEAANKRRADALRAAYGSADGEPRQVEDQTRELEDELRIAKEHADAAAQALIVHINRCIATVVERGPDWIAEIDTLDAEHAAEIKQIEEQLVAARRKGGGFSTLRHWIERTAYSAAKMPADHFPFSEIPAPPSGDPEDEREQARKLMLRSYAGGMGGNTRISDDESLAREQAAARGERYRSAPDLNGLGDDDLVDWLMGTGRFDGQARPCVSEVVEAAGSDPAMASRLLTAENVANPVTVREDLVDALSALTREGVAA